ncbi:MAG: hypothetical protein WC082_10200 [Victivallales bacterium]
MRHISYFSLSMLLLLLCACSSMKISKPTSERMIAINSDGTAELYSIKMPSGEIVDDDEYTYEQQLESIINGIKKSGRKKILLYAFGGMNSLNSTVERTEEMSKTIYDESDYYPVMINWESSLADSYFDHLFFIRRGIETYSYGPMLFPFYLALDIGRAVVRLPINIAFQSHILFSNDPLTAGISAEDAAKITELKMRYYAGEDYSKNSYPLAKSALFFVTFPVRILATVLIDVGGKSAWDVMIRRSTIVFQRSESFEATFSDSVNTMISPPDGALSLFMNRLVKLVKDNPDYEITLIGHSMGAFIINEMLCRYDTLFYKNLVYMAPACSCSDAAKALRPYLEKYPKSTFYNLCIQPNLDSLAMMAGGLLPRGSVLTWIDLYFTNPLTSNDHCLGIWYNAMYCMPRLMGEVQNQCVIKAFGVKDPITNTIDINMPQDHTDFSDTKLRFWEPEFWQRPKTSNGQVCPFVDRLIKIGKD